MDLVLDIWVGKKVRLCHRVVLYTYSDQLLPLFSTIYWLNGIDQGILTNLIAEKLFEVDKNSPTKQLNIRNAANLSSSEMFIYINKSEMKNRHNLPPTMTLPLVLSANRKKICGALKAFITSCFIHLLILTLFLIFSYEFFHNFFFFFYLTRSIRSFYVNIHIVPCFFQNPSSSCFTPIYVLNCSNKYILFAFHIFPHELTKIDFEAHTYTQSTFKG